MATLSFVVGIIGAIISVMVFAAPIKTFRRVVKKKSTDNYKGDPYVTTFLSTSLWTFYGALKPHSSEILVVNGAGAVFQCIYILLFLIYSPPEKKVKMAKLVGIVDVAFVGAVISVTLFALHGTTQLTFLGILCSALTIVMYASPLLAMKTVIKTKSVEYMPFLLSFFLFVNAGVWAIYSILVKDLYIAIPNIIGFALGSAQLIIYVMYKKKAGGLVTVSTAKGDKNIAEMGGGYEEVKDGLTERGVKAVKALKKGKSLPKPAVTGQQAVRRVLKTLSFGAYNLPSAWANQENVDVDVELGVDAEDCPSRLTRG